jgi:hypothetical protein
LDVFVTPRGLYILDVLVWEARRRDIGTACLCHRAMGGQAARARRREARARARVEAEAGCCSFKAGLFLLLKGACACEIALTVPSTPHVLLSVRRLGGRLAKQHECREVSARASRRIAL